jgi:hypothetical protein
MPWGVAAAAVGAVGAIGGGLLQSSSASKAAADQEQAAMAQLGLNASVFNAQGGMSLPTREVGGLAQSREAYLLGLTPNLDISPDFSTPNITAGPNGSSLSWNGPAGQDTSITGSNPTNGAPSSFGGNYYGGTSQPDLSNMFGTSPAPGATATGGMGLGGSGVPLSMGMSASGPGATLSAGAPAGSGPNSGVPNLPGYGSFASPYDPSTFYQDPGYNFIKSQGLNTIQNQQATTGLALSPSSLTAALGYSSGLASQEFNNAYNRSMNTQTTQLNELNALSSGGQIATSGLSTAAGNFGAAGSSALAGYGNAGAAGAIGQGNAFSSGLNGLTNAGMYGLNNYGYGSGFGSGSNPQNLGGSIPVAPAGSQLTYDGSGNITGSVPITD